MINLCIVSFNKIYFTESMLFYIFIKKIVSKLLFYKLSFNLYGKIKLKKKII